MKKNAGLIFFLLVCMGPVIKNIIRFNHIIDAINNIVIIPMITFLFISASMHLEEKRVRQIIYTVFGILFLTWFVTFVLIIRSGSCASCEAWYYKDYVISVDVNGKKHYIKATSGNILFLSLKESNPLVINEISYVDSKKSAEIFCTYIWAKDAIKEINSPYKLTIESYSASPHIHN